MQLFAPFGKVILSASKREKPYDGDQSVSL